MTFAKKLHALALVSAGLFASSAFATTVLQDTWPLPETKMTGKSLSRAEVKADLQLWKQAGLDVYQQGEGNHGDPSTYSAKMEQYQQQRNSPAFAELVKRIEASSKM